MKETQFWKSTNFWFAALMFAGSFFGLQESTAQTVVMSIVGVIAAGGLVRQFLQSAKFGGWKETLIQGNTLNYLAGVLATIGIPQAAELIEPFRGLADALIEGNWGLVITRAVAFVTVVFYLFFAKKAPAIGA